MSVLKKKMDELTENRKDEVMKNLKDLGNTLLGIKYILFELRFLGKFGLSLDNFKMQQNEGGSYNIAFQK